MAFQEIQASTAEDLVTKLATFCKNTLKWHSVTGNVFQPYENKDKFEIYDFKHDHTISTFYQNVTSFKTKIQGDTAHSGVGKLIGIQRVWFKGDRSNVFVVIETANNNFRWFGFGIFNNGVHDIAWNVGQWWRENAYNEIYMSYFGTHSDYTTTFFGMNGYNNQGFQANVANRIKYKNEFFSDRNIERNKNFFGGGMYSYPFSRFIDLAQVKHTGQRLISKTPMFIHRNATAKRVIIGEMPLWYVCSLIDVTAPHQFTLGNKRYIAFPVCSQPQNDEPDNLSRYAQLEDKEWVTKIRTGYNGFALCMDD